MSQTGALRSTARFDPLSHLLQSGSTRVFNCLMVAETLAEGDADARGKLLFKTQMLNHGLVFKDLMREEVAPGADALSIRTKVYLPFNRSRPTEGGQSFYFNRAEFMKLIGNYVDLSVPQGRAAVLADVKVLELLDTLPMFAPFLVRSTFERAKIDIDPAYVAVPQEEWEEICAFVRGKFQQIVRAVSPHGSRNTDLLLEKLWDLSDMPVLEALAPAFGLPVENCAEYFYAWKGTIYFCWAFERLRPDTDRMIRWLANGTELAKSFPAAERIDARFTLHTLHEKAVAHVAKTQAMLAEYDQAFDQLFVQGHGPGRFISFLRNAPEAFQQAGFAMGVLQHAYEVWNRLTHGFPNRKPPVGVLAEVLEVLESILGSRTEE